MEEQYILIYYTIKVQYWLIMQIINDRLQDLLHKSPTYIYINIAS